jgi:hypothetical protein
VRSDLHQHFMQIQNNTMVPLFIIVPQLLRDRIVTSDHCTTETFIVFSDWYISEAEDM